MNYISRLSTEVLINIFQFVKIPENNTDIYECISVCRSWKCAAQIVGYSSLTLKNLSQFNQLVTSMNVWGETSGRFVKTFNYTNTSFTEKELTQTAYKFPFLEHLNIPELAIDNHSNIYEKLAILHQESKLCRLRSFTLPMDNYDSYMLCAVEYRHTLTKLSILTSYWRTEQEYPYYHIKSYMKLFPNLRELHINDDPNNNEEFDLSEDFLDDCTTDTVKSVYITTEKDVNPSIDLTMIKPRLNVETLHLRGQSLLGEEINDSYLHYILHKFPRLKEFNFRQHDSHDCNDAMYLLHFISQIPAYNFNLLIDDDEENEESEMLSQFWDLPSIKTRFKKLSLSYHYENDTTTCMDFRQQQDISVPSYFSVTYPKNTPCFDMIASIEKLIVRHAESFRVLSIALSRGSPEPITFVPSHHHLPSYSDSSHQQEDELIIDNLLTSILGHCKNLSSLELKYLKINKMYDVPVGTEFSFLSSLSLIHCAFIPEFLSNLSPSIPKLKILKLYSFQQTTDNDHDHHDTHDNVFFDISMPQTAIDVLDIENTDEYFEYNYNVICKVSVASEDKVKYFSMKHKSVYDFDVYLEANPGSKRPTPKVSRETEKYYHASHEWKRKRNVFYNIQCLSIKQITIKEPNTDSVTAFNTKRSFK